LDHLPADKVKLLVDRGYIKPVKAKVEAKAEAKAEAESKK